MAKNEIVELVGAPKNTSSKALKCSQDIRQIANAQKERCHYEGKSRQTDSDEDATKKTRDEGDHAKPTSDLSRSNNHLRSQQSGSDQVKQSLS